MPQDTSPEVRNSDDPQYVEDYPPDFDVPHQRAWGFLAFLACAFGLAVTAKHQSISERVAATAARASVVAKQADASLPSRARDIAVRIRDAALPTAAAEEVPEQSAPETPFASVTPSPVRSAATRSVITFQTGSVTTTEKAVTAVFVLTRSPPLGSRARVHWAARSGPQTQPSTSRMPLVRRSLRADTANRRYTFLSGMTCSRKEKRRSSCACARLGTHAWNQGPARKQPFATMTDRACQ
jgi:hypothetical protein